MLPDTERLLRDRGSELVFGLVAPVGADLTWLEEKLATLLQLYGYSPQHIRLSGLLKKLPDIANDLRETPEVDRINTYMDGGNKLRNRAQTGEVLALWAISEIYQKRQAVCASNPDRAFRTAYILRSIKHPDEARALRAAYGPGFFLISISVSRSERISYLKQKGMSEEQAIEVINRDAGEANDYGQQTRDAFQLADVFIRQEREHHRTIEQLQRFLDLVFGSPHLTPTPDEHAMFLAYASSLRSGDLSRQVGAVIWRDQIGVVATGCNDVPAPRGGLQWAGPEDQRDHVLGHDANETHKLEIAFEIASRVQLALGLEDADLAKIEAAVKETRLLDITEYGRAVHAEMDALLNCTRVGIDTRESTLFSTTFPCHNCAKHIVAAGIKRVVYIEPYEKSKAIDLHGDAIIVDDHGESTVQTGAKVVFTPFVGVGPRRYFDLFSMKLSHGYQIKRKLKGGAKTDWSRDDAIARVPMLPTSYIEREALLGSSVSDLIEDSDGQNQDQA
ncbi:MAG: anti-phage dCTP deaminase [Enhygromyxa sp.]